jgi:hypothetical protein
MQKLMVFFWVVEDIGTGSEPSRKFGRSTIQARVMQNALYPV